MPLAWVLEDAVAVRDLPPVAVAGLVQDSRAAEPGDLFFACAGEREHGLRHAAEAVRRGAVAVAYDPAGLVTADLPQSLGVPLVPVARLGERLGAIADRFYGAPSRSLTVIGVTGTNGKTSCSHYLAQVLAETGLVPGIIGTLGYGPWGALTPASHTTPDAISVHHWLNRFHRDGCCHAVMEVSSHGLCQGRVAGVHFDTALWTNLSRDHLDYHGGMQAYAEAKARLFMKPGLARAVVNGDDGWGRWLLPRLPSAVETWVYGFEGQAAEPGWRMVQGMNLQLDPQGLRCRVATPLGEGELRSPLWGRSNAYNLLGVLAVLLGLGVSLDQALARLAQVRAVPGRMERFGRADGALAVVDYAHTPDALLRTLSALRAHTRGRLICVFGCGGDRDRGKRPQMGRVAVTHADQVILTDDNPRSEDPEQILADIQSGMADTAWVEVIRDRARAITAALDLAQPGDVVLVAGKGHEETQIVKSEVRPFSDRALVAQLTADGDA